MFSRQDKNCILSIDMNDAMVLYVYMILCFLSLIPVLVYHGYTNTNMGHLMNGNSMKYLPYLLATNKYNQETIVKFILFSIGHINFF